jgi:hypothetical protein
MAAADALASIESFIKAQLPCASVQLVGNLLTVNYGANGGNCTYDGVLFSGVQTIAIGAISSTSVEVDHTWTGFSNGYVDINGNAQVTWTSNASRQVTSNLTWTRMADGMTGQGSANVTQSGLGGDFSTGIEENGSRSWSDVTGDWSLTINDVQQRWVDPVPQAGSFNLDTAKGKDVMVTFSRINPSTIAATVTSGGSSFTFDVTETGTTAQ